MKLKIEMEIDLTPYWPSDAVSQTIYQNNSIYQTKELNELINKVIYDNILLPATAHTQIRRRNAMGSTNNHKKLTAYYENRRKLIQQVAESLTITPLGNNERKIRDSQKDKASTWAMGYMR